MILHQAYKLADRIKGELSQFCDQIEIAGSIRRARPEVGDIDLVMLPKAGREDELRARIKSRTQVCVDGPQTLIVRLANGLQLDCWFARHPAKDLFGGTPGNFGTLLVARTGSREHNIYLCQLAQHRGFKWDPHSGICDQSGKIFASETEREVFDVLGLDWIAPAFRER